MNQWKDLVAWGVLGGMLRVLVDYRGKSVVEFIIGLIVAVLVAIIVGSIAFGFGVNRTLALATAGGAALAADYIAVGVITVGRNFQEKPFETFIKWLKREN